jgi:hypothetical protein
LLTLSVVGFLIYKNIDKFIPPSIEVTPQAEPEAKEPQQEQKNEQEEEEMLDQPDPFAPPA